jgi:hypothetical protein
LTETERKNIENMAVMIAQDPRANLYFILEEAEIILEHIKTLYKMGVYWVEMGIKKQNDLPKVMKELDIQNKIDLAVLIEKEYFAWKQSWKKIYNGLTEKERQRR